MLKYLEIPGYSTIGELQYFSHVYQWIEATSDSPSIILVKAYEGQQKAFKGKVFHRTDTYMTLALTEAEKTAIESVIGSFIETTILDVVSGTEFEEGLRNYTEVPNAN